MRRARGFTLIEVLVALVVMSTMAMMAWRGLDALVKSREIAQAHLDQSARLQTVLAQWEQDLRQIQDSGSVEALNFDGASLRLTRQHPQGIQVVAWLVRGGALNRWESKPALTVGALEENFKRGAQLLAQDAGQLRALEGVTGWQLYCYRGNSWSNCLSSGGEEAALQPVPPLTSAAPGAAQPEKQRQSLPTGIRMLMQFGPGSGFGGPLTRQVELRPQS